MLQTKYVFVDTEAFRAANFSFHQGRLKRLQELLAPGMLSLLMPSVTDREIRTRMAQHTETAIANLNQARKAATFLEQTSSYVAGDAPDASQINRELNSMFDDFLKTGVETLAIPPSATAVVFDQYFEGTPPFGSKKKHEFPDAFALATLTHWLAARQAKCYVVSHDSDLEKACAISSELYHLRSLDGLLELVEVTSTKAMGLLRSSAAAIEKQLAAAFGDAGFYLADEDGDVENVRIVSITIADIGVNQSEGTLTLFWASADVEFRADVSYWDSSTATYDNEDHSIFYHHRVETTVRDTVVVNAYGRLRTNEDMTEVRELELELDSGIDFAVDPSAVDTE